jgi:hypothetical protein
MTLLITLASKLVVHQSSDYRLSCSGKVVETANGTKQLSVSAERWTARVAFTGIAFDGQGYHTLDWIQQEGVSLDSKSGPEAFVENLAGRGTEELKRARADDRRLTVLVVVLEQGRCRLFLVSNFEDPRQNFRCVALDALQRHELDLAKPVVQVNGRREALQRRDKRCLEHMLCNNSDPKSIRDRMALANREAARAPRHKAEISEGCWVFSLFADGREHGWNCGEVSGIPGSVMPGFDLGGYLKNNLLPAPGQQVMLRQTASVHGAKPVPMPPPTGAPREIRFSTPSTIIKGIGQEFGAEFPRITFEGRDGVILLRKNEQMTAVLGTVTLEIDPKRGIGVELERQQLSNLPTVDGAQPRTWDYMFDLHGRGDVYTLQLRTNSVGLRTPHCTGLGSLGPNEELVLVAPIGDFMLFTTPLERRVSREVVASFLIRDYPELSIQ